MTARFVLAATLAALSAPALGAACTAQSGPQPAALLELYTSEGCSSCPPADRWFSRLDLAGEAKRIVPLAFHVEYWDTIGWKDRFADPAWSARQREAVRRAGGRTVYTPQVMRNGRDFPRWHAGGALERAAAGETASPVTISLRLESTPAGLAVAADAGPSGAGPVRGELFVALTENRLASTVRAGENRGKALSHDHVVRRLVPLGALGARAGTFRHVFALASDWKPADLAVAAFVQDARTGEVLQALRLANCAG
ncbi:MAG: DUF1223 domain-containing protein [Betaproteobacteria bacterium]|nr:DUF1223 domain-containing protein [Betaproteobacteria bacterium]